MLIQKESHRRKQHDELSHRSNHVEHPATVFSTGAARIDRAVGRGDVDHTSYVPSAAVQALQLREEVAEEEDDGSNPKSSNQDTGWYPQGQLGSLFT